MTLDADNKGHRANRVAWVLANGLIAAGLVVCHRCDVPACCNPAHLFLGTMAENVIDRDTKGRGVNPPHVFGEATTGAKLTESDVLEIRRRYTAGETHLSISKSFNVKVGAIGKIVRRERWTHV